MSIVVRAIQNPMNSYTDLNFVIPQGITDIQQIDKGFIYVNNIAVGTKIGNHITKLLPPELRGLGVIRPYNAAQSKDYRKEVMEQFKAGNARILICTNTTGMGCIPDIDFVMQWKLPVSVSMFVQRARRAACTKSRKGLVVLLVEQAMYAVDIDKRASETAGGDLTLTGTQGGQKGRKRQKGERKAYAQA
ncbi:hypothetical protein BV22DRAFT_1133597 [Leucogyrophana mollusca]|uniref:Uncharacterized protein n=1 Tax=Leucogyrophana mollusca TaxID=85980 RepID=A0ACB8B277_9AGAM|nr:hypothetical protein BV22DRAFT_1133597 [Leucogyrophana mollusca]